MKIHIIGPSGSGKTYLAQRLGEKYHIPVHHLDEIFWDNSSSAFSVKRDPETRDAMLAQILKDEDWIIEGVQHTWVGGSFAAADQICLLETPAALCRFRIVKRSIQRKLHNNGRKNETLASLIALLKWTRKFYAVNLPEIRAELQRYDEKVIIIKHKAQLRSILDA